MPADGASMGVYSGGTATGTTINMEGAQYIYTGGMAIDTYNVGEQHVYGKVISTDVLTAAGSQRVYSGGKAISTDVIGTASQTIEKGGTAIDTYLDGTQNVYGKAIKTIVDGDGYQHVYSGGTASGTTVKCFGHLDIKNGATLAGEINIEDLAYLTDNVDTTVTLASDAVLSFDVSDTREVMVENIVFIGEGKIVKTGNGILKLLGSNTCTDGTEVRRGTLEGYIGTGPLTVSADATCTIPGSSVEVKSLNGGGNVANASVEVDEGGDFSGTVYGSLVSNGGSWDIAGDGSGTLTVTGTVNFTNAVTWRFTRGDLIDIQGSLLENFSNVTLTVGDPDKWTENNPEDEETPILTFSGDGDLSAYNEPDGHTFDVTSGGYKYTFNAVAKDEEGTKKLFLTLVVKTALPGGGGNGGGGGGTVLSNIVTPLEVYTKIISDDKGTERKIVAEKQPDEITFAFLLPAGTDLTKLPVYFSLPDGATVDPKSGTERDFTTGPLSYTVKAENGVTTGNYFVTAKLETVYSVSVERACFVTDPALCSIVYDENADESFAAVLSIPYLSGMDGKNTTTLKATLTGLDLLAPFTCAWNNANCLQITLKLADLEALKSGRLEKIDYWLKGDGTNYVQTYTPPLDLSKVPLTAPSTPEPNSNHKGGGGGCDAGFGLFGSLLFAGLATLRIPRKREMEK